MAEYIVIDDSSDEEMPVQGTARPTITIPNLREVTVTPTVRPVPEMPGLTITSVSTCFNSWCNKPASVIPNVPTRNYFKIPMDKNVKICKDCKSSTEGCDKVKDTAKSNAEVITSVDLSSSDEKEDEPNEPPRQRPSNDPKTNVAGPKPQPKVIETIDVTDTLDFTELKNALDKASQQICSVRTKAKGPVCCNSWCTKPATVCPEEHIRDYYNIPTGKNFKLCDDCIAEFYKFKETVQRNIETNGDLLEGMSTGFNEFIVLEDESDEEDDESDAEMEKLLEAAIKETMEGLDQKYDLKKMYIENTERICEKLENLPARCDELGKHLSQVSVGTYQDSEDFKKVFQPPILALADIEIPYSESQPEVIVLGGVGGDSILDDEEEPDTLPSFGELNKPVPKVGDTFLAMKEFQFSEWIPFKIAEIIYESDELGNFIETYTVETSMNGFVYRRVVNGDHLAYTTVADVRLGIGSRVLGAFSHSGGNSQPNVWYSGMIAELPTSINQFRYLVFFDDGKVRYCPHEDLRVVYKTSKKIHEYFTGFNVEFVQSYLSKFPERAMVKTNTEHFVRVELNGFWISGKVDMLDGSLVRVTFASDKRSEWIYRGSPRLRPVFEKIQADLRNPITNELPVIRQVNNKLTQHFRGGMPSHIIIDSSDEEDDQVRRDKVRSVAKKSTTRPMQPQQQFTYMPKRQEKRMTRASVIRRYPDVMQTPNIFRWHKCSYACVTWVEYNEEKTKGINPLAIPSIFAFKRDIDVTSSVTYTAPCGKKLKNIQEVLKYLSETLIPLTLDMFDFDIRTQIFDEFVVNEPFVLMEDISYGEERNPIACVNEVDNSCPDLMNYMTVRRPQEGVHINLDPGFLVCCDCTDNCRDRSKCRCWRLTIDNFRPFNIGDDKRHITKIGYQYQRLDQNVLSGIYECNSQCACNKITCINRVVQHTTRHKLQLFKTPKKGWGTRCINDIPQGVFISTYVGNILTEPKANETGTINGDEYFAELDHIEVMAGTKADYEARAAKITDEEDSEEDDPEPITTSRRKAGSRAVRSCTQTASSKRNPPPKPPKPQRPEPMNVSGGEDSDSEDEDSIRKFYGPNETVYVMDAKIAGNIGRYFNHSCDPNIFVQNVYVDTHDLRFPWVAFFALRHIPAGTELTWDYGYRIGSVPGKVLYCYCGSSNCRKRLL